MELTIRIDAPELVNGINNLAMALTGHAQTVNVIAPTTPPPAEIIPQPQQAQAPVTPQMPTVAPVQAPAAPQYQPPAAPVQQPIPQAPIQQPVQQPSVPTTAPTYTMEQLAVAATQLTDAGRRQDVIFLLNQFGVQSLTALPKEQYGAFATSLRGMGAKI